MVGAVLISAITPITVCAHRERPVVAFHSIVGIKNHESPNPRDHIFKARIVLGGHDVRDATGAAAIDAARAENTRR